MGKALFLFMHFRKIGRLFAIALVVLSCKTQVPKKSVGTISETSTQEIAITEPISIANPNEMIIEPLNAGHLEPIRVAFYNLENLFDTIDGPNDDAEYLPNSSKQWNTEKYLNKLQNMARVIDSIQPHILGVCEVENLNVLKDLKDRSSWLSLSYANIVHQESPDKRGIDVAIFYTPEWAFYGGQGVGLANESDKVTFKGELLEVPTGNPEKPTRGILHATFRRFNKEIFTVFVNHWPSRSGGELKSRPLRANAAKTLRNYLDSNPQITNWIAMGDFNDNPEDSSLRYVLGAGNPQDYAVNLAYELRKLDPTVGTGLYRGNWDMFDQIIISKPLYHLGPNAPIPSIEIYKRDWLLQSDGKYKGHPFRTFGGKNYLNGYSDHLPVTSQIYISIN